MLESLCIPRYDSVRYGWYRDNVLGAGNQQERLIQLGWVIGFVDGEGCFSIGFFGNQTGQAEKATRLAIRWPMSSL
jgi:hypothetical protein